MEPARRTCMVQAGTPAHGTTETKRPFDINEVIARLREAVAPLPKAALFELAEDGYISPFEQLVACVISIRSLDEVVLPAARRIFERARTPAEIA
jgi:endonuclease-3